MGDMVDLLVDAGFGVFQGFGVEMPPCLACRTARSAAPRTARTTSTCWSCARRPSTTAWPAWWTRSTATRYASLPPLPVQQRCHACLRVLHALTHTTGYPAEPWFGRPASVAWKGGESVRQEAHLCKCDKRLCQRTPFVRMETPGTRLRGCWCMPQEVLSPVPMKELGGLRSTAWWSCSARGASTSRRPGCTARSPTRGPRPMKWWCAYCPSAVSAVGAVYRHLSSYHGLCTPRTGAVSPGLLHV